MAGRAHDLLAVGRAALRAGDAAGARRAFEEVLEEIGSDESARASLGETLEGLAAASYLAFAFDRSIDQLERAYAAYRNAGQAVGAVRAARTLGYLYGSVAGDWAVAGGWISRAKRLVADDPDSPERGWVSLTLGMFESDRGTREARFREALDLARKTDDVDLTFATLAYLGASLVHDDRTEEGMVLLDEALAAAAGGEVDDFVVLEEIFCQLFSACERAHDVTRAEQWIRVGDTMAARRNLPTVSAYCRTHFGGVMTAAGRWPEAEAALTEAIRLWGLGEWTLKKGALTRLADLRVRQGRLEEAEKLVEGLHVDAEVVRPLAALYLARGETGLAHDLLERALARADPASTESVPLYALLVDVQLAEGRLDEASASVDALAAVTEGRRGPYLRAVVALARGRLALAGTHEDPRPWLREALDGFADAQLPLEAARSRLDLASACVGERPEVAVAEARAALETFERLKAARHVDAATSLLRTLGERVAPGRGHGEQLTRREAEVLELLGHGLSNAEISDRLFISRKTVEHHVGNVLAKLGLRSRAQAAAYAVRAEQATK